MEKICLITDSPSDLTHELAEQNDVRVLPVTVNYGGMEHKEFEEIDIYEYWDFLEQNEELPSTAQITPAQYIAEFHRAREEGFTKVLCLVINANGSGTYASGMVARDLFYAEHGEDMEIRILDSQNYTIAYGQAMVLARHAIENGATFEQVIELVEDHISRVEAVAAVYTLRQMRKSGRIGGAAACVGELLGIKPLIHLCGGRVDVAEKARGERNLLSKLCEYVDSKIDREAPQKDACAIIHAKVPEEDFVFIETFLREKYGLTDVPRIPFGCSLTTNTGPNVIGIVYYGKKRV